MKNLIVKKILLAVIVLPLAFIACKDDDDKASSPSPNPGNGNGSGNGSGGTVLTFKKDGTENNFSKEAFLGIVAGTVSISGEAPSESVDEVISINFSDSISPGTYSIQDGKYQLGMGYTINGESNQPSSYFAFDGTLKLEEFDKSTKSASGTFHFTGMNFVTRDTLIISNGKFDFN